MCDGLLRLFERPPFTTLSCVVSAIVHSEPKGAETPLLIPPLTHFHPRSIGHAADVPGVRDEYPAEIDPSCNDNRLSEKTQPLDMEPPLFLHME